MDHSPLLHASRAELAVKTDENLIALTRDMAAVLAGQWEDTGRLIRYHTLPSSAMFKGVLHPRLSLDEVDDAVDEAIAWFKDCRAPYFFWWVDSEAQPADLSARLAARGLILSEHNAPAMAADIPHLNWRNPRPDGLRLDPALDERRLDQWKDVFTGAFCAPESAGQAWVDATRIAGPEQAPWKLLLGSLDGEPACCGILYCGAGVAGLVGLGTLPAFRRRGIGSAMQLERLRIARELGYRYAVLYASDQGYSAYAKLGFMDVGRKMTRYLWLNG